jgi:hypothetical protein
LVKRAHLLPLELPEELRFEHVTVRPAPHLKVFAPKRLHYYGNERLQGKLSFVYENRVVPQEDAAPAFYDLERRQVILRDRGAESAALARLHELGFRTAGGELELTPRNLPKIVRTLVAEGWHIEAEGKLYRRPGNFQIEVKSGIDWFELHGTAEFGDSRAHLPELLAVVKRGDNIVQLDDGTFGMVPEEWLRKYGVLAGLGAAGKDHVRFSRCQVGLLDALLAAQPEATCDATFTKARAELRRFDGIAPADPPATFTGELRPYQRDGLGWFDFLQRFGFGGCLADDMGLGKTVQVLALLEARRLQRFGDMGGMLSRQESEEQSSKNSGRESMAPARLGGMGGMLSRQECEEQSSKNSGRESMAPARHRLRRRQYRDQPGDRARLTGGCPAGQPE